MASFGKVGEINAEAVYSSCFGALPSLRAYYDPHKNIDMRKEGEYLNNTFKAGLKALNVAGMGSGATDKVLIPLYLDPSIIDISRKYTPLVELIPRVSNRGITAEWNVVTKNDAFFAAEDAALNEVDDTPARRNESIKYLYAVGRVTGPTLAAMPSFMVAGITAAGGTPEGSFGDQSAPNAMQFEVIKKTRSLKELEENAIINGDKDTNALEFSGFIKQIGNTNRVDKNTSALDLADINRAVRNAFDKGGRPNLAVCASAVYEDLQSLLLAKFGYMQSEKNLFWGYTTLTLRTMVGEIPIIPSMFMSNSSGSKAIYFLDLSVIEMRVLQDMTYENLAKTNDSNKFFLKIYECLAVKAPEFCSSVMRIS